MNFVYMTNTRAEYRGVLQWVIQYPPLKSTKRIIGHFSSSSFSNYSSFPIIFKFIQCYQPLYKNPRFGPAHNIAIGIY